MKVTSELLKKVCEEYNKVMELDPAIPTGARVTQDEMIAKIKEANKIVEAKDKFSKATMAVLTELGIVPKVLLPKEKKEEELSRYGYRKSSMKGALDDMLHKGYTIESAAEFIKTTFKKNKALSEKRVHTHLRELRARGLEISFNEKTGVYKAQKDSL